MHPRNGRDRAWGRCRCERRHVYLTQSWSSRRPPLHQLACAFRTRGERKVTAIGARAGTIGASRITALSTRLHVRAVRASGEFSAAAAARISRSRRGSHSPDELVLATESGRNAEQVKNLPTVCDPTG